MKSTDPQRVRVTFPDGYTETGVQVAPTGVELGPAAVGLRLGESLQIDGRRVVIVAQTVRFEPDVEAGGSVARAVRITFADVPG